MTSPNCSKCGDPMITDSYGNYAKCFACKETIELAPVKSSANQSVLAGRPGGGFLARFLSGRTRKQQTNRLIEMGIPKLLKIPESNYRNSIPAPDRPPSQARSRFSIPVLVEPRLTVDQCLEISPVANMLVNTPGSGIIDKREYPLSGLSPFWRWCNLGESTKGMSAANFLSQKKNLLRQMTISQSALTATEGIFLASHHYDKVKDKRIILAGTVYSDSSGNEITAILEPSIVGLTIDYFDVDRADPKFGCATSYGIS